jgi:uncharacterized membrane protein YoaK (UPF0700 family)
MDAEPSLSSRLLRSSIRTMIRLWGLLLLFHDFRSYGSTRSSSNGIVRLVDHRSVVPLRVGRDSAAETFPAGAAVPSIALPTANVVVVPTALAHLVRKEPLVQLSVRTTVGLGSLLALNAGYLNGLGLLGALGPVQSVTVVTGALTHSALHWAKANPSWFLPMKIVLSYMLGSGISGYLNPFAQPRQLSRIRVSGTLAVGTLLLALAAFLHINDVPSMNVYYFLTAANGLQNGLTSTYSGKMIRSTHYTGLTSDTGTYIGEILQNNKKNVDRVIINTLLAISFWSGAAISYFMSHTVAATVTLLLPSMLVYSGLAVLLLVWKPTDPKNA